MADGMVQAVAFVGGALGGWRLGQALGYDLMAPGFGTPQLIGWLFILAGLGVGKALAGQVLRWLAARRAAQRAS